MDKLLLDRIYEFPLTNRIRYFLRYESLMLRLDKHLQESPSHNTIEMLRAFFEILELTKNIDLKSETMQQLRWQIQMLEQLSNHPQIQQDELQSIITKKDQLLQTLEQIPFDALSYRNHHFLNAAKRRLEIPGGVCSFDIPMLTAWMRLPWEKQMQDIRTWSHPFMHIYEGISDCLTLSRREGEFVERTANDGYYSQDFNNRKIDWQMLRIRVEGSPGIYPEISAGKPRFTIHFFSLDALSSKPPQTQEDIQFKIALCQI